MFVVCSNVFAEAWSCIEGAGQLATLLGRMPERSAVFIYSQTREVVGMHPTKAYRCYSKGHLILRKKR